MNRLRNWMGASGKVVPPHHPSQWIVHHRWLRYTVAVVSVAVALLASSVARPLIDRSPFLLCWLAVAVTAWYGGLVPALGASLLSIVGAYYLFLSPNGTFALGPLDIALVLVFLAGALVMSFLQVVKRPGQAEVYQQREWLRITLSSIGDAVIATDEHGTVSFLNPIAESLTGWRQAEASGKPLLEIFTILNEKSRQPVANPIDRVLADGIVIGLANHTVLIARDGTEHPIADSGAPIKDAHGAVVGTVLVFRDVTDERRTAIDKERLAAIVEGSDDAIISKDLSGRITSWNRAAEQMYGYTAREAIGQPIAMLVPLGQPDETRQILERIKRGERIEHYETRRRAKDGRVLDVALTVSPIRDEEGAIIGASKIARDITKRKLDEARMARLYEAEREARTQAEEANHAKNRFLANLTHDLRTPLNSMMGMAQVLLMQSIGLINERQQAAAKDILTGGHYLLSLLNNALDLSRKDSGQLKLQLDDLELSRLIDKTLVVIRQAAQDKGIQVETDLAPDLPVLSLDENRLVQVLTNLLSNALKFTPPGGRVGIRAVGQDNRVKVEVWDTGIGIPLAYQSRLFQPFERLDEVRAMRQYEGAGLGLALSKQLVELHGGTIGVISAGEGLGTTFYFTLPLPDREGASRQT